MTLTEQPAPAAPAPPDPTPPAPWHVRLRRWLAETKPQFQIGTLRYTGLGMVMVFFWLLWGDLLFTLLDQNVPSILPLKLNHLGASDTTNSVLNGTFAYAVTFFLAPIVSVWSDRTRTRWGRRIPYLFWSTPFVGLFLVLIGCYESVTHLLTGHAETISLLGMSLSRGTVTIAVLGALIIGYDLANIFVSTIYYYLFNDVVPTAYMSRFLALFRIVFLLSSMVYGKWIFPHSMSHFRLIFVLAGVAYVVGFMLMCVFIREGKYPPPPENIDRRPGMLSSMKTYAAECFTHKLYWWFFIANACTFSSRLLSMFFDVRNTTSLGMSMEDLGRYKFWLAFCALLLQFPAGWLSDRWHPLRVYLIASSWALLGTAAQCVWIAKDFGPEGNLTYLFIIGLGFMPLGVIAEAAELPMYMRLLPRDRYGQFASANAMVRAFARIFLSVLAGAFIGWLAPWFGDRRYTWISAWQFIFQAAAVVFLILLYRQWKLHGGNQNYVPPQTTSATGLVAETVAARNT